MNKKNQYADSVKETLILTLAVAIIAAAVYFFLVPSHASVSSISGLGIILSNFVPLPLSAITMILNVVLLIIGFFTCGREFGAKTVYTSIMLPLFLGLFEKIFPDFYSMTGCTLLYTGRKRRTCNFVQSKCLFWRTGYCCQNHEQISAYGSRKSHVTVRYVCGSVRSTCVR